ncbi:MAG TPA: hypothetical protein VFW11_15660 [Cyclobacteriaceae bacterium]|nr:hypothetical protein [Cyclobacteriaceae bacterium]
MKITFFNIVGPLLFLLQMGITCSLFAQGDDKDKKKDWTDGELEDVQIEIIKEREITLPKVNRNFEKIPPRANEPIIPPITYDFRTFNFQAPEVKPSIKPLRLKQESSSSVYGGYVTGGFGNYSTPYAEAFLNSRKDKNKLIGAHAWFKSSGKGPIDDENSASGTSGATVYGKTFGEYLSFSGKVGFETYKTHFYGYPQDEEPADRSSIKQFYNIFSLGGSVSNTKSSDFSYQLGADFSHLNDHYDAQETIVDLGFKSAYRLDEETSVDINATYSIISRKDELVDAKPRNLFQVNGAYVFIPMEGLSVKAGLTVAYENDTLDNKNIHVFPDLHATYTLSPTVDLVGALTGGVDKVSLHSLSRENWWVEPNIPIYHTNRNFEFLIGINARLSKQIEAHAGLSAANLKNLYYFVNSPGDQSMFTTVYDNGTTKRNNIYGSISYAQSEKAKFMLRADYYTYTTDNIKEAWHKPTYSVTANALYNIYDKILLKADLIMQGGMKAFDQETQETIKLDGAFDLNARAEYLFSPSFSFFVELNNITSSKYPLFYHYPVRSLQVLGGVTWSF